MQSADFLTGKVDKNTIILVANLNFVRVCWTFLFAYIFISLAAV